MRLLAFSPKMLVIESFWVASLIPFWFVLFVLLLDAP